MKKKNTEKSKIEHPKSKKSPIATVGSVILLVIIIIAFIASPSMFSSQTQILDLGSYNGEKIKYDEDFNRLAEYFAEQFQTQGIQTNTFYNAMSEAFNYSVLTLAFIDEVEKSGYVAPDSLINREMVQYFLDEDGVFSQRLFRETSDGRKIELREATVEQVSRDLYYTDYSGLKISSNEIDFIKDMNKNQRTFNMASFNTDSFPQEEIIAYGSDNAQLFTQYAMQVITVNSETEAETLLTRITNNELTFSDAVSEFSTDNYSDDAGVLTDLYYYQIKNIIEGEEAFNTLVNLEVGSISEVLKTTTGYSIFSVTSPKVEADFTNPTLVDTVYSYLTIYERGIIEDYFINLAKDFASTSLTQGYAAAVSAFGVETYELDPITLNYAGVGFLDTLPVASASQLSSAVSNEQFFQSAFSLQVGEVSEPIVLGNDIIVLSLIAEVEKNDEENQNLDFLYPYLVSQYDAGSISTYFTTSDKLENNLYAFLSEYFL